MRVFILCTGRSGSNTIIRACEHIENFTSGHETLSDQVGENRFNYPDNHIEADNRLSWFLGTMDKKFGEAFYIHLIRNKKDTVNSFNRRWVINGGRSIITSFAWSLLMTPPDEKKKLKICERYYDTVNDNIEFFLKSRTKKLTIHLEAPEKDFMLFWDTIGAKGNLDAALNELKIHHNSDL